MRLTEYQRRLEALETDLNRETYRQYAGLPYDEARMEAVSAEIEALAGSALRSIPQGEFPRPLFYAALRSSRASDYTRLDSEIYRLRGDAVRAEIDGESVTLHNWRLFNRRHARDAERRRKAFAGLLERASVLTPLLAERFTLSRSLFGAHSISPLDAYLEEEGIEAAALAGLIEHTARAAQRDFTDELQSFSEELLGKSPEHYDDFYVFMNLIYAPVDRHLAGVDFHALMGPIFEGLGLPLAPIVIDPEPREGKYASPVCFGVRIPQEVYVLFQRTSPIADYTGYAHEMGHALHFAAVDPSMPYADRYLISAGACETFSTLFEALATTPAFLSEEVGLPPAAIADIRRRERFMDLFFLTFYAANSLFKMRYWTEAPGMETADAMYADLYRRYVGQPMPGRYWQAHHVLSTHDVYAPSYLLARIRVAELWAYLTGRFGERWWRSPDAGRYLRGELMSAGRTARFEFSTLDPEPFLASLV